MLQRLKEWMLPLAILTGACFHSFFVQFTSATPYLLFGMLLIPFCKISLQNIRFTKLHFSLLAIQISGSVAIYALLHSVDPLIAQGTFICILAPTATASAVITGMLGGNIASVTSYSLLSNLGVAIFAPLIFSFIGNHTDLSFGESLIYVCKTVAPLILSPLLIAAGLARFLPKVHQRIKNMQMLSFYLWAVSLIIVISRTVDALAHQDGSEYREEAFIAISALIVCILQFTIGRKLGRKYGDTVAGGQGLGQKNTILAIWMAQTYLNPIAAIGPSAYILWQNSINSYQIWANKKKQSSLDQ